MEEATVLYMVKSVVQNEHADSFNKWYHETHIPEILELSGCNSAKRFKAITSPDRFEYIAVYGFETLEKFLKYQNSDNRKRLIQDYKDHFAEVSELESSSWMQIWPNPVK